MGGYARAANSNEADPEAVAELRARLEREKVLRKDNARRRKERERKKRSAEVKMQRERMAAVEKLKTEKRMYVQYMRSKLKQDKFRFGRERQRKHSIPVKVYAPQDAQKRIKKETHEERSAPAEVHAPRDAPKCAKRRAGPALPAEQAKREDHITVSKRPSPHQGQSQFALGAEQMEAARTMLRKMRKKLQAKELHELDVDESFGELFASSPKRTRPELAVQKQVGDSPGSLMRKSLNLASPENAKAPSDHVAVASKKENGDNAEKPWSLLLNHEPGNVFESLDVALSMHQSQELYPKRVAEQNVPKLPESLRVDPPMLLKRDGTAVENARKKSGAADALPNASRHCEQREHQATILERRRQRLRELVGEPSASKHETQSAPAVRVDKEERKGRLHQLPDHRRRYADAPKYASNDHKSCPPGRKKAPAPRRRRRKERKKPLWGKGNLTASQELRQENAERRKAFGRQYREFARKQLKKEQAPRRKKAGGVEGSNWSQRPAPRPSHARLRGRRPRPGASILSTEEFHLENSINLLNERLHSKRERIGGSFKNNTPASTLETNQEFYHRANPGAFHSAMCSPRFSSKISEGGLSTRYAECDAVRCDASVLTEHNYSRTREKYEILPPQHRKQSCATAALSPHIEGVPAQPPRPLQHPATSLHRGQTSSNRVVDARFGNRRTRVVAGRTNSKV